MALATLIIVGIALTIIGFFLIATGILVTILTDGAGAIWGLLFVLGGISVFALGLVTLIMSIVNTIKTKRKAS